MCAEWIEVSYDRSSLTRMENFVQKTRILKDIKISTIALNNFADQNHERR